jgi:hypothetical protein
MPIVTIRAAWIRLCLNGDEPNSLQTGKNTGNFTRFGVIAPKRPKNSHDSSSLRASLPCNAQSEQGINSA